MNSYIIETILLIVISIIGILLFSNLDFKKPIINKKLSENKLNILQEFYLNLILLIFISFVFVENLILPGVLILILYSISVFKEKKID